MIPVLESLFEYCMELGASDIHLSVDEPPRFRVQGHLAPRPELETFDARTVDEIAMDLGLYTLPLGCPDGTERVRKTLVDNGAIDGARRSALPFQPLPPAGPDVRGAPSA